MIERVYKNMLASGFDTAVVTDNDKIEAHLKERKINYHRVDDNVISGSERIALALERFYEPDEYDVVINVQGDEPLLKKDSIKELAEFHANSHFDIATIIRPRNNDHEDFNNPNIVKAVYFQETGACPYFSRSGIPNNQRSENKKWFQHIGVYSYRPKALRDFTKTKPGIIESQESLEQLRALELGLSIGAIEKDIDLIGVDIPSDIAKVEAYFE